jgi:hypothetical protein
VNYGGVEDSDDNFSESDGEGERSVIPKHLPLVSKPITKIPTKMPGSVIELSSEELQLAEAERDAQKLESRIVEVGFRVIGRALSDEEVAKVYREIILSNSEDFTGKQFDRLVDGILMSQPTETARTVKFKSDDYQKILEFLRKHKDDIWEVTYKGRTFRDRGQLSQYRMKFILED